MTVLKIYEADTAALQQTVVEHHEISDILREAGIRFEAWQASATPSESATPEQIIEAYRGPVDALIGEYGFQSVDVIALGPDHPERKTLRKKFLAEHTHSEFEVRFFVEGQGLFYIHHEDKVYGVMCQQGDLISVPAGVKHWFDMGEAPDFKCIRLFTSPEGWVADYTGDKIAGRFPMFEAFQ